GFEVEVLNFIPDQVKRQYSMNPFEYSKTPRVILSLLFRNFHRRKQNQLFRTFQRDYLKLGLTIRTAEHLHKVECEFDYISVGSDQVWNVSLTGTIKDYYLDFESKTTKKMSYAGSFGTNHVNKYQIDQMKRCFPNYTAISVREVLGKDIIKENTGLNAQVVCDPVFLLNRDMWSEIEKKPDIIDDEKKYVLYYTLKYDRDLIAKAEEYAQKHDALLYAIHPTAVCQKIKGKQLYDVGPMEFVWLVQNAFCVVTNSFHATAFSVIFRKKLIYKSVNGLGGRVTSLFRQLNLKYEEEDGVMDLVKIDDLNMERLRRTGTDFLDLVFGQGELP
ncbi:polysaccharide pyruvyl transferase family protein, partial [Blautia pseudococcoides]|nr:polysaccharide pyruvyl transferase family protein [Blautia pseudococcoides]